MSTTVQVGNVRCGCTSDHGAPSLIVLTGGPGAGKTAVLHMILQSLCNHVAVLPESAGIVFGGGFPRHTSEPGRRGAQRAIYHVQHELERIVIEEGRTAVSLCDRGSLDGAAYWPGTPQSYLAELETTLERELARYRAVIHLRTPGPDGGYNHSNPLRIESAREAAAIDQRILEIWSAHPRRTVIECQPDFVDKASRAIAAVRAELPACCQVHPPR